MDIINMIVEVGLYAACFIAGLRTSDRYHDEQRRQVEYEVRLAQARMKAKDYAPYVKPVERKRMPIGQPFFDRLKKNGRATQQINRSKEIS